MSGIGDIRSDVPDIAVPDVPSTMDPPVFGDSQAETERFVRAGPVWTQELRAIGSETPRAQTGTLLCDGWSPVRHFLDGNLYRTGLLAPFDAPTVSPAGTRATGDGIFLADVPADLRLQISVGRSSSLAVVKFVTSLDATGYSGNQVLSNTGRLNTAQYLADLINDAAGQGSTYVNAARALGFSSWSFKETTRVEATAVSDNTPAAGQTTVSLRALDYGTIGNTYIYSDASPYGYDTGASAPHFTEPASGLLAGGTDTGDAPEAGVYDWGHAYVRSADGAQSAVSPVGEASLGSANNVNILDADQSEDDADSDYVRYFRTLQDGGVLYRFGEVKRGTVPNDDRLTDNNLDTALTDTGALPYDESLYRPHGSGHIPRFRYVVAHLGALFGAGRILRSKYDAGTVSCTSGTNEVTLASGYVSPDMEGMTFRAPASEHIDAYRVVRVDQGSNKFYLNEAWRGANLANSDYELTDEDDPLTLHYTPPLLYNCWPPGQSIKGVTSRSQEGVTGLASMWESLIIWTRDGLWRLSGSSIESFQLRRVASNCGCYAGAAVVAAQGVLYWLGPDGVWRWDGASEPALISKPRVVGGVARGCHGTILRINDDAVDLIHGAYHSDQQIIRWWLPLDDAYAPNVGLTLDLQTGAWGHDVGPEVTAEAEVLDRAGDPHLLIGTHQTAIYEGNAGNSDGAHPDTGPIKGTVSGGSKMHAIHGSFATGTIHPGAVGLWINAAGEFERFVIASHASDVIYPAHPLSASPAEDDLVIVGPVCVLARSGRFDVGIHERIMGVTDLDLGFAPLGDETSRMFFASAGDQDDLAIPGLSQGSYANLSKAIGAWRFFAGKRCRFFQFELRHFITGLDFELLQYAFHLRVRGKQRASR